jgi:hypothetical protein
VSLLAALPTRSPPTTLLYATMACGAVASMVFLPALVLTRVRSLGGGDTLLLAVTAMPGLAGLASLAWTPPWRDLRAATIGAVACGRLVLVAAMLAAPLLPGKAGLALLLAALLAAHLAGMVVTGAVLAWFARLLDREHLMAVSARRNALGLAVGFAAALAAGAAVEGGGEAGGLAVLLVAVAAAAAAGLLLTRLPTVIQERSAQAVEPAAPTGGYQRLWWRLQAGGAIVGLAAMPALAAAGFGATALVLVGGASAAGAALGMWKGGSVAGDPGEFSAAARARLAGQALVVASVLAAGAGLPAALAVPAAAAAALADGLASGRCAQLDLAALYRFGGSDPGRLARLTAQARCNGGLIALAGLGLAAACTALPSLAAPLLLAAGLSCSALGWRALARQPSILPDSR